MIELGVFPDKQLEVIDDEAVVGGKGRGGKEAGDAGSRAESGVGLTVGTGALVEDRVVNFGIDEVGCGS